MHNEEQVVTLESLGSGAAVEIFGDELQRVLENIQDPNTDPKTVREVTLKLKLKPNEHRDMAVAEITATSKLASVKGVGTTLFMGKRNGRVIALEQNPRQMNLDDIPTIDDGITREDQERKGRNRDR